MMRKYLPYFLVIIAANAFGQAPPVINDVQPLSTGPNQKLVITGNGFSTTSSQLAVWFDHVKGTITSSSNFSIEVTVPAQARFSNVEVINLAVGLSAKSKLKFMPSYGGQQFDITKVTSLYTSLEPNNELFDVASADLDMDGKADLVTTKGGPTTSASFTDLYVYQNTSSGIGSINYTRSSLTVGAPTVNVVCGDINGDGKPEIVATRGGSKRNEVLILKNTNSVAGTMSFALQTALVLPAPDPSNPNKNVPFAFKVSIRDLNGDGKPEIIVCNSQDDLDNTTDNRIYVFQNNSSGGNVAFIAAPIQLPVVGASSTYGLEVQDIDGDAMPDLIVHQFLSSDIFIFRNNSTGNISFDASKKFPATANISAITTADVDNDGLIDLITTANLDNNMQIWFNKSTKGNVDFNLTPKVITTSTGPWGVEVSDIDGDGDVDFVVANKGATNLNIFRQDAPLNFTKLDFATPNYFSRHVRVGDYDGDAKPDIAFTGIPAAGLNFSLNVLRNSNCWNPVITSPVTKICLGQTVPLVTETALGVSYDWKLNASSTGGTTNSFNATAAGSYTVNLKGTFDTGCDNTSPALVLVADNTSTFPSDPSFSPSTAPCVGTTLTLTINSGNLAGATYKWTGPNNFTSTKTDPTTSVSIPAVTTQNAGVYTLQVIASNGCMSNIVKATPNPIIDIASVPVLPVTAAPSATGCTGSTITLSLQSGLTGYTFVWNKGGTAISPAQTGSSLSLTSVTGASEGDYSVVVTSTSNSCSQETAKTTVKVLSAPVVNFTIGTPQCKGDSIQFTDGSTTDSRGIPVYAWNFGDAGTSSKKSPKHLYSTANSYNPSLTISYSGASSCSGNASKPLTVNDQVIPVIMASANPICKGDQTTLSISGSYSSISWSGGTLTGNTSSVFIADSTKYFVNTTDANGCNASASIHITFNPLFSPLAITTYKNKTSIASGDTLKLTASTGADTYAWTPAGTLSDATISNPIASPTATTKYVVLASKAGFCSAKDSITVSVGAGEAIISPPVLFSPNGDAKNDTWKLCYMPSGGPCPEESKYVDWTMTIFDGHGSQVYQQKGFTHWDGGSSPDGVYYYVFSNSQGKPVTGSVLLVRQKQ